MEVVSKVSAVVIFLFLILAIILISLGRILLFIEHFTDKGQKLMSKESLNKMWQIGVLCACISLFILAVVCIISIFN